MAIQSIDDLLSMNPAPQSNSKIQSIDDLVAPGQAQIPQTAPQQPMSPPQSPPNPASIPPQPGTQQQSAPEGQGGFEPLVNGVTALVGGMSDAAASTITGAGWLLNKLGVISPTTKKQIDKVFESAKLGYKGNGTDDPFNKAATKDPIPALVGQLAPLSVTNVPRMGAGALGLANKVLGNAVINASQAAGMAGTTPAAQDAAGGLGSTISAGLDLAGGAIGRLAKTPLLRKELTNTANSVTDYLNQKGFNSIPEAAGEVLNTVVAKVKAHDTANWNAIKGLPGVIDTSPINQISKQIMDIGQGGNLLAKPQVIALQDLTTQAGAVKSMEDIVDLRNNLADAKQLFSNPKETPKAVRSYYNHMQNAIESQINEKAKAAGLGAALSDAKDYYRQIVSPMKDVGGYDMNRLANEIKTGQENGQDMSLLSMELQKNQQRAFGNLGLNPAKTKQILPLLGTEGQKLAEQSFIKKKFDDILANPESLDQNALLGELNKWKLQNRGVISKDNMQTVDGAIKLLEQLGAVGGKKASQNAEMLGKMGAWSVGAGIGGSVGYQTGGIPGAIIGGLSGPLASGAFAKGSQAVRSLLNSPQGVTILKGIQEGRPWLAPLKKLISTVEPAEWASQFGEN